MNKHDIKYTQCAECNRTLPIRYYKDTELRRTFTRCIDCRKKPSSIQCTCPGCNLSLPRSEFITGNNKKYVKCKTCRVLEYQSKKAARRAIATTTQVRKQILETVGFKCERCGYGEFVSAMCFHHIDPTVKDKTVATLIGQYCAGPTPQKWEKIMAEVAKCIVLCANCHNAFHAHEWE